MLASMVQESGMVGIPGEIKIMRELRNLTRKLKIPVDQVQARIREANGTGWYEWLRFWTDQIKKNVPPRMRGGGP